MATNPIPASRPRQSVAPDPLQPHSAVPSPFQPHAVAADPLQPHSVVPDLPHPHSVVPSPLRPHSLIPNPRRLHTLASNPFQPPSIASNPFQPPSIVPSPFPFRAATVSERFPVSRHPSLRRDLTRRGLTQCGSALLTVLWLSAALAAVGMAVANTVRIETERTATNVDDAKAYFLACGAIEQAALRMFSSRQYQGPDGRPLYYLQGVPTMELAFPAGQVHIDIIPEAAKLSLNDSPPADLLRLLTALGVPPDPAAQITAAIIDWRTPPDPVRPSPFDSFYSAQQPSFSARHASFQENEELLLVKGITPDLYYGTSLTVAGATAPVIASATAPVTVSSPGSLSGTGALRDCISVFGSTGTVDINTAQPATLLATGLGPQDVDSIVRLRANHPIVDGNEFSALIKAIGPASSRLTIGGRSMFTLRATARLRTPDGKLSDMRRSTAALVKMNYVNNLERREPGIEVLRWYDRP